MKHIISQYFHSSGDASLDDLYKSGVGLLQKDDFAGAARAYRAAAAGGHLSAIYNLALLYKQGLTECFEIDKAIGLFKQAADRGHERAKLHVALFQKLGGEHGLSRKDLTDLVVNFSRVGGDGAFVFGVANEIMRTTPDRDLPDFVYMELDGASDGNTSAKAFVYTTGIPRSFLEGSLRRSVEGTPARIASDFLDNVGITLINNGIPQSSVVFARCSIVGYVIKTCGIAPMDTLLPFTAYKDDAA